MALREELIRRLFLTTLACLTGAEFPQSAKAEKPYFVTYDDQMEEPGNFELSFNPVVGLPQRNRAFVGSSTEFEYGAKGWWTTEFYLDSQSTRRDSTIFTGFRWENRFRALAASPTPCAFCRENFKAGAELYGGLGDWHQFGFRGTAHYLGPLLTWELPGGTSFRISPTFGLNRNSARLLVRFGVSYELPRFDRRVRRWFR